MESINEHASDHVRPERDLTRFISLTKCSANSYSLFRNSHQSLCSKVLFARLSDSD